MTGQIAETLRYQGENVAMFTNPLEVYFALGGFKPSFQVTCTALWRGYRGHWEIIDGRLYLLELHGTLEDGTEASVATLFPDFPERVFAHWYSGTIRIPQGEALKYVHMGYGSTYERDLLLNMERGVIMGTRIRENSAGASDGTASGVRG